MDLQINGEEYAKRHELWRYCTTYALRQIISYTSTNVTPGALYHTEVIGGRDCQSVFTVVLNPILMAPHQKILPLYWNSRKLFLPGDIHSFLHSLINVLKGSWNCLGISRWTIRSYSGWYAFHNVSLLRGWISVLRSRTKTAHLELWCICCKYDSQY